MSRPDGPGPFPAPDVSPAPPTPSLLPLTPPLGYAPPPGPDPSDAPAVPYDVLSAPYDVPVAPVAAAPRPRWRRTRRACTVLAVVGVLAAAAGTVVAVRTVQLADTPEAAVRAYFDAVARGDARSALAAGSVPTGGRVLVTDDVLRATLELAPLRDVRTGTVTRTGTTASVAVRYRVGGATPSTVDDRVEVVRADGRWQLRRSAVPVELGVTDASSWAAVPASRPFAVPTGTQLVFPGAVPVVYRTPRLQVAPASGVVRMDAAGTTVGVTAQVTESGLADVTRAVRSALGACAGKGGDPYCPQPTPGRAGGVALRSVPASFRGTLQGLDRLDLTVGVTPESAGTLSVSAQVTADGTWQVLDYDNVAQDKSGSTTIEAVATVPVGSDVVAWERS